MHDLWAWITAHVGDWVSSAWIAAVTGRLAWHTRLVQKGERRFFSHELALELPIVAFTYLIGTGAAAWLGWTGQLAGMVIAVVSYLGPGGLQWAAQRYLEAKGVKP